MVSVSSGCSVSSWIVRSATWIWSGMLNGVLGVISPASSAPGDRHHLERRARFVVEADRAVLHRFRRRGARVVGVHLRPVRQRQDRAAARVHHDRGRVFRVEHARRPRRARLRRAAGCWRRASASATCPAPRGWVSLIDTGWPSASLTTRRSPERPLSSALREYSRPASPLPSVPTTPSTCAASVPRGYTRRITGVPVDAGDLQREHRLRLRAPAAPAPGTRSRCARRAFRARSPAVCPSSGASRRAAPSGSVTR